MRSKKRCLACGKQLKKQSGPGKPKKFCNAACKQAWYRRINSYGLLMKQMQLDFEARGTPLTRRETREAVSQQLERLRREELGIS